MSDAISKGLRLFFFINCYFIIIKLLYLSHINNLKYKKMIEAIVGGFIYYVINTIEKDRKAIKRVKNAKKELFTDDRPKYISI